jgi:hypothetical protein
MHCSRLELRGVSQFTPMSHRLPTPRNLIEYGTWYAM